MTPYYTDDQVTLYHGDCLDVIVKLPDNSVDAVVADPPYNLSFMAKPWDALNGRDDAGFAYWLAGLIDGEGHFAIKSHTRGTHAPYFQLKMRADELGTLEMIHRTMRIGSITYEQRDSGNPMARWIVQDKSGCQALVNLLDKYPLRAKKRIDYWTWREAVCEWTSRPRGNRWHGAVSNDRMATLRDRLMATRAYTDVPWSGHEFQDWCRLWASECLRVLKPGGHMLAFGGSRTWHRLACAVEDAGFEIRDSIAWLYGSGFPKSLDVSKAIDKQRDDGADRQAVGAWLRSHREGRGLTQKAIATHWPSATGGLTGCVANWELGLNLPTWDQWLRLKELLSLPDDMDGEVWRLNGRKGEPGEAWRTAEVLGTEDRMNEPSGVVNVGQGARTPVTRLIKAANSEAARQWQGWGTALKPAFEPIVVARKPLAGTVAANVLEHGTGALNIDACRIGDGSESQGPRDSSEPSATRRYTGSGAVNIAATPGPRGGSPSGRWPTNVVLDEAQAAELDAQTGYQRDGTHVGRNRDGSAHTNEIYGARKNDTRDVGYGGGGGGSRFFPVFKYQAKAPAMERPGYVNEDGNKVAHNTVKPLDLMRWLVRLVTPPNGVVLDPFAGSGTTAEACIHEHKRCITIEREADYLPLIVNRLSKPIEIGFDFEEPA
ncbi:DNA methylase [Mycobacterium phage Kersh]|uniref:DNA methylase n=4 Tax=Cheoctovirus TaxID=1623281 RepID=A0A1D8EXS8_9CAUD|nr:methyltransferase [Mycobacterium phage Kersh]AOT26047.1 DNA methylase [Mycobacterium phage Kersh]